MKDIALRIKDAIERDCEQHHWTVYQFCEFNGFTPTEFLDFLDFGAQGYSDFLEQMEDGEPR